MKKNVASQFIGVQMITAADGSDFTGSVTCTIAKDGAALGAKGGTGPTHQATGYYEYAPTQAETNADHIAFHFVASGAISTTVQVYTGFPQTVDNNVLAAGSTGFAAIDTVVDGIDTKVDTIDTNVDAVLVDTGTTIPATIATAQADLDTITGADGVTLLSATQASIDAIEVDTGTTIPGTITTVDGIVDAIVADTIDIQSRIPAALSSGMMSSDVVALSGSTAAANNLEASALGIVASTATSGTLSTTQMTTNLTEVTDDHYSGCILIFTSGVLSGQRTDVTDYTGSTKLLQYTELTEAPSNTDSFVLV